MRVQGGAQALGVDQVVLVGLVDGSFEPIARQPGGEVEEGAHWGGDGDGVAVGEVVLVEGTAVDHDACSPSVVP